jgi:hypothetical protein
MGNRASYLNQATIDASMAERDAHRASDFSTLLLAMAAHDLRQPLQVVMSRYCWQTGATKKAIVSSQGMQAIVRLSTNSTASLKPCVFMKDQSVSPLYCGCAGAIFQATTPKSPRGAALNSALLRLPRRS